MMYRAASDHDLDALTQVGRACFGANAWEHGQFAGHFARQGPRHIEVAEGQGCVGYGVISWAADEAEIEAIAVLPAYRRQGVATTLLWRCLAVAHGRGARTVHLEVRASNDGAQVFYLGQGFAACGRRRDYYRAPIEDAVLMRRDMEATASRSASSASHP